VLTSKLGVVRDYNNWDFASYSPQTVASATEQVAMVGFVCRTLGSENELPYHAPSDWFGAPTSVRTNSSALSTFGPTAPNLSSVPSQDRGCSSRPRRRSPLSVAAKPWSGRSWRSGTMSGRDRSVVIRLKLLMLAVHHGEFLAGSGASPTRRPR
jgi:hypothetical protein